MIWHLVSVRSIETPLEVLKDFHTAVSCQEQQVRSQSMMNIHTYIDFLEKKSKILKQEIQQVECDIITSEQNTEESVGALKDLLAKIENCFA